MAESLHEMAKRWLEVNTPSELNGDTWNFCIRVLRIDGDFEKLSEKLRAWAAANPAKTYRDDFFEKFPGAMRSDYGTPRTCIANVYGARWCPPDAECRTCWEAPLGTWGEKEKKDD